MDGMRHCALLWCPAGRGPDATGDALPAHCLPPTPRRLAAATACRPEPVLRRALDRLIRLLRDGEVNYFYALDQFKVGETCWVGGCEWV